MSGPSTAAGALLAVVRDPQASETAGILERLDPEDQRAMLDLARRHRVVPFVREALRRGPRVASDVAEDLERWHEAQVAGQVRGIGDLRLLADLAADADVPWLTIKGPVLAHLLYPRPELRTYADIDVVVPRARFADLVRAMSATGWPILDRNWTLVLREERGQLHVRLPLGTVADVHWHLLNRQAVRRDFAIDTDELFSRRRSVDLGGFEVPTLGAADTLTHLCFHAALSGGGRLLWLLDVRQAIRRPPIAWPAVVERARAWRAGPPVALILGWARAVLGAEVPDGVLAELSPPWRRRLDARVGWRVQPLGPRPSAAALWAQASRERATATLSVLGRRAVRRPLNALRPAGAAGARVDREAGDEGAREAYLRRVSEEPEGSRPIR